MSELDQSEYNKGISGPAKYLVGPIIMIVVSAAVFFLGVASNISIQAFDLKYIILPLAIFLGMAASFKVTKSFLAGLLGGVILVLGICTALLVFKGEIGKGWTPIYIMCASIAASALIILALFDGASLGKLSSSSTNTGGSQVAFNENSPEFRLPSITKVRGTVLSIHEKDSSYTNIYSEPERGYSNLTGTSVYYKRDQIKTEFVRNEQISLEVQDESGDIKVHKFVNHNFDFRPGHKIEFVLFNGQLERVRNMTTRTWTDGFGEFLITDGRYDPSNVLGQTVLAAFCLSVPVINVISIFNMFSSSYYNPSDRRRPYLGSSLSYLLWSGLLFGIVTTMTMTPVLNNFIMRAIGMPDMAINMSFGELGVFVGIATIVWTVVLTKVFRSLHRRAEFMQSLCEKKI